MLPSHLMRMIGVCVNGDYNDPAVRQRIKFQCIPQLSQHRREVLNGSFKGRHDRPVGFICKMVKNAQLIRRTLTHAHQCLNLKEPCTNVLSFAAAQRRRNMGLAATA
ncbi:hypothetical protein [Pseudomonas sp. MWU12-2323]|uniref:hypothetical protein n=1 Tax=Pseudomonas sp. MWU12-2323 TaxID=2651296 RepID=UPI00128D0525|nr:hypothetical protein [Pseudomonas sp. MWU12-2323]MPQ71463.1 hypothetical protein [Pseudomonas sp. MWU12-2323]